MKGICYLVCAGESVPLDFEPQIGDFVIAVDGGLAYLEKVGIKPNIALGDFDSLGRVPTERETLDGRNMAYNSEKDVTDTYAAAEESIKRGYTELRIYCALGGRLSHTLANIHTLSYLSSRGVNAKIIGKDCEMFIVRDSARFERGGYLSLLPIGGDAEVLIENCKYGGRVTLTTRDSLGVSNEPLDGAKVTVLSGEVLAITERK